MVSCSNDNDKTKDDNSSSNNQTSQSDKGDKNKQSNKNESSAVEPTQALIDTEGLGKTLLKEISFKDNMGAIDDEVALLQYNITKDQVEDVVMYLSTGASAEEIAIFKVKDDSIKQVQSAVEKRVEEKKISFKDYNPNELPKLENPTMYTKGNYVVLCISDEDEKSRKIIDEYLSTK